MTNNKILNMDDHITRNVYIKITLHVKSGRRVIHSFPVIDATTYPKYSDALQSVYDSVAIFGARN